MERSEAVDRGVAEVEWALSRARSGEPTLRVAGAWVHSAYDPRREARTFARGAAGEALAARAGLLVLLGHGLGYLPAALAEAFAGEILVFDPFPELTGALSAAVSDLGPRTRVTGSLSELGARLDRHLAGDGALHVAVHPGYTELCRFERRWVAARLRRRLGRSGAPPTVECVVSPRALDALVRLPFRRTLDDLRDACAGQTAVLVAPGPSLRDALPALARRETGVLFAAVQALRPLCDAGVKVDFAVAPDALHSTPFVRDFEPQFGALLAETGVEPELLDRWPERTFLFPLRSAQLYDVAWGRCGVEPIDEPMNTVSETALLLAHRLGARRFALVGIDLCGPEKGRFAARTDDGGHALTNPAYLHAARYLSATCPDLTREGCEIWRVGGGLPIAGTRAAGAGDLPRLLAGAPPFSWPAPARVHDPTRERVVHELLTDAARAPATRRDRGAAPDVDAGNRWSPFSELPGPARPAACERALRQLESARPAGPHRATLRA